MRLVIVESPLAARPGIKLWWRWWDRIQNRRFARACMRDCFSRGEAPFASHLLYPQIYKDARHNERLAGRFVGMTGGWAWMKRADAVVVYCDRGISPGMRAGIQRARQYGIPVEQRLLDSSLAKDAN